MWIVTNNPLVKAKLASIVDVQYHDVSYLGILHIMRDQIHAGSRLLTHPLSGSVKPNETPYKSVLMESGEAGKTDLDSLKLIEAAEATAKKFIDLRPTYVEDMPDRVKEDCQLIDYTLIISAFPSAGLGVI